MNWQLRFGLTLLSVTMLEGGSAAFAAPMVPAAPPSTQPTSPHAALSFGQHLRFRYWQGRIFVRWMGDFPAVGSTETVEQNGQHFVLKVAGINKFGTELMLWLNITPADANGDASSKLYGLQYQMQVAASESLLMVSANNLWPTTSITSMLSFTQASGAIVMSTMERDENVIRAGAAMRGANLAAMAREYPADYDRYVEPLLETLMGRDPICVGPTDVYSAFPAIAADSATLAAVQKLIPVLADDDPRKRDQASRDLEELGAPGVRAVLRIDRRNLSLEQKRRLERFIREGSTFPPLEYIKADHDIVFLLQCLKYPDSDVRQHARGAIERLVGHAIDFDPAHAPNPQSAPFAKLRENLLALFPATPEPLLQNVSGPWAANLRRNRMHLPVAVMDVRQFKVSDDQNRQAIKNYYGKIPSLGQFSPAALLKARVVAGMLDVQWLGPTNVRQASRLEMRQSTFPVFPDWCINSSMPMNGTPYVQAVSYCFDRPDGAPWMVNFCLIQSQFTISYQVIRNGQFYTVTFWTRQQPKMVAVNITNQSNPLENIGIQVADLPELLKKDPDNVRTFIEPVLQDVLGIYLEHPPAAQVYRVFDRIAPSSEMTRKVQALLPDLDDADFVRRQAASDKLRGLGDPAILASQRILNDPTLMLTPEQSKRLGALSADVPANDPRHLATNVPFLLECLGDPDAAVRAAARDNLERVMKSKLAFDPNAAEAARTAQIQTIRQNLGG